MYVRYDSHREQILRGGVGGADDDEFDGGLNLWPYFSRYVIVLLAKLKKMLLMYSRTCYEKFDDEPGGFFAVYTRVFSTLVEEEEQFGETKIEGPLYLKRPIMSLLDIFRSIIWTL